ncbi:hypothetical protein OLK001_08410 [Synechocystis sp. LKSZ1]
MVTDHKYPKMERVVRQHLKAEVIKELRKELGLSQAELGSLLGSDQTDISRLERGQKIPDWLMKAVTLNRLLQKAQLSFDDLLLSLPDPEDYSKVKES